VHEIVPIGYGSLISVLRGVELGLTLKHGFNFATKRIALIGYRCPILRLDAACFVERCYQNPRGAEFRQLLVGPDGAAVERAMPIARPLTIKAPISEAAAAARAP
jgi:hypothetical protein